MKKFDTALIGLGVMGKSLARNIAGHGFSMLVYNRTTKKAEDFIAEYGNDGLDFRRNIRTLIKDIKRPRKIILMVNAGPSVNAVIRNLLPHLQKGDVVIDGGNSHYSDTIRRSDELSKKGFHFVGLGVSGGEEGALKGPSLMPGCSPAAWKAIEPILTKIAAKDFSGKPTVTHVGTDGAGHYVKMVHNGIEYGVMQMMAEAYDMLRKMYDLTPNEIADVFSSWNRGKLNSYLFGIAVPVLKQKDDLKKGHLIDFILDSAGQKGTGRWTAIDALNRGAVLPTITEAVFARTVSSFKEERIKLSHYYQKTSKKARYPQQKFIKELGSALYSGMVSAYAQGFDLIRLAAGENGWRINLAEIARIWEGGCIIRAGLLNLIHKAFFSKKEKSAPLFAVPEIRSILLKNLAPWRFVVSYGIDHGIPLSALAASLEYFESMTSENLPANFIQGLRDYFGAHTYERTDRKGVFHALWNE